VPYRRKKLTFAISSSDEFLCVSVLTSVCKLHLCIHLAAFVYYVIALFAAGFERVLNGWMHVLENLNCYRTCSNASFRARTSRFSLFLMYVSVSCLYKVKQYMPASSNRTELYHSQCFSFVVAKKKPLPSHTVWHSLKLWVDSELNWISRRESYDVRHVSRTVAKRLSLLCLYSRSVARLANPTVHN